MLVYRYAIFQLIIIIVTVFIARMRDANVRILKEIALYLFIIAISSNYGIAINVLLTDKSYLMNISDWTLKIAIRYFVMKHVLKPRDYSSNK
jgi:hypothetical protein